MHHQHFTNLIESKLKSLRRFEQPAWSRILVSLAVERWAFAAGAFACATTTTVDALESSLLLLVLKFSQHFLSHERAHSMLLCCFIVGYASISAVTAALLR